MHRFYCELNTITKQGIVITDKGELHHMRDVMRLGAGSEVTVLDGQGGEFSCRIKSISKKEACLDIVNQVCRDKKAKPFELTIACALPKKSKIQTIVEKLTEIGVDNIILLSTERTEVKVSDAKKKLAALQQIAIEALKQSGGVFLPKLTFMNFAQLVALNKEFDLALLPNLGRQTMPLRSVLENKGRASCKILAAIGPEGDFSQQEVAQANAAGFISVSLGDTVLKVDTAAVVVAGFIKLYLNSRP